MLTPAAPRCRRRAERGSVLLLVPAGVLVLFVLGSITVDFAIAFMAQRELTSAAAAAANDAAGAAISDEAFYRSGGGVPDQIVLDDEAAERFARAALAARRPRGVTDVSSDVRASVDQVCVAVTGRVEYIFAKAIPGGPRGRTVTGTAVATAVRDGGDGGARVRAGGDC